MDNVPGAIKPPGFLDLLWFFIGISTVTIGGGYVMVPAMQRALQKRGWVPEAEFYDLFAASQSVPGPLALNMALFVGRRLAGFAGFAAAFLGIILPPFASILAVALLIDAAADIPAVRGFLEGASAVVPGLVAALAWNMAKNRRWTVVRAVTVAAASVILVLAGRWAVPAFFAIVAAAFLSERKP